MSSKYQEKRNFAADSEVMKFYEEDKENNKVIIFEGSVYDVGLYMP
jgi:hypothetical protein